MKKNVFILLAIVLSNFAFSQVGINTPNPLGTFHVDGGKDNPNTGNPDSTQSANDFVITSQGNVGLGTITPTHKLHIEGSVKIVDGTQGIDKVLTSDANGSASWNELVTDTNGSLVRKIKYEGSSPDGNKFVVIGDLDFRIGPNGVPEVRFNSTVNSDVTITYHSGQFFQGNGFQYNNYNRTFTTSNWNTWQNISFHAGDAMSTTERNEVWLVTDNNDYVYNIDYLMLSRGANRIIYSIIVTRY